MKILCIILMLLFCACNEGMDTYSKHEIDAKLNEMLLTQAEQVNEAEKNITDWINARVDSLLAKQLDLFQLVDSLRLEIAPDTTITLMWNPSDGADGYKVYWDSISYQTRITTDRDGNPISRTIRRYRNVRETDKTYMKFSNRMVGFAYSVTAFNQWREGGYSEEVRY